MEKCSHARTCAETNQSTALEKYSQDLMCLVGRLELSSGPTVGTPAPILSDRPNYDRSQARTSCPKLLKISVGKRHQAGFDSVGKKKTSKDLTRRYGLS